MRRKKEKFGITNGAPNSFESLEAAAKVERQFADVLNFQRKQANNLLGVFEEGAYNISDQIKEQLLLLPKKFDRIEDNLLYAASKLGEFVLNFKIEMKIAPDYCEAKLFIIEIESGVEEDIKHTTLLAEMTEPYIFEFRKEVCERWNVFYDDEVAEKNDFLYQYLHLQYEEFQFNRELVEMLSQLYLVRMMALLDKLGGKGEQIRAEYKKMMERLLQLDPSLSSNHTKQKMIFDSVMREFGGFAEVLKTEEGVAVLKGYAVPLENIRDKNNPILEEGESIEKKPDVPQKKASVEPTLKKKPSSTSKPSKARGTDTSKSESSERTLTERMPELPNFPSSLALSAVANQLNQLPPEQAPQITQAPQQTPTNQAPTPTPQQPNDNNMITPNASNSDKKVNAAADIATKLVTNVINDYDASAATDATALKEEVINNTTGSVIKNGVDNALSMQ